MGKTKRVVASLMLSTALLPMLNSKADTTPASSATKTTVTQSGTPATQSTTTLSTPKAATPTSSQSVAPASATALQPKSVASTSASASSAGTSAVSATGSTAAPISATSTGTSATQPVSVISATAQSAVASQATSAASTQPVASQAPASQASTVAKPTIPASAIDDTVVIEAAQLPASVTAPAKGTPAKAVAASAAAQPVDPATHNQSFGPGYYDNSQLVGRSISASQEQFLNEIKAGSISGWHKYQVLPSVTAAQAILESGWGQSQLATLGNNLFGIKGSYQGQSIDFPTQEWNGSQYVTVEDAFRKYPNWSASVEDHGAFLNVNPRYSNLLGKTDYRQVASLLQQDGYATAPTYASLLISIIQSNQLHLWDLEAINTPTTVQPAPGNNANPTPAPTPAPQPGVTTESGRYTFTTTTPIHSAANQQSSVVGTYEAGDTVNYNGRLNVGTQTWLQYLAYSGATHYVMINSGQPTPGTNHVTPTSGSYKFTAATNIRDGASKAAKIVGTYDAGNTVYYNGTVKADGLTWLRYLSYSGTTHYVATSGDSVAPVVKPVVTPASGAYRFTQATAIKGAPADNANTVGTYDAGETVYYNAKVAVNGQTWLRYLSYSGSQHYVQISGAPATVTTPNVTTTSGAYRFTANTAIKAAPSNQAATVGTYSAGNTVYYNGTVSAEGQTWLRYLSYSGALHYVAVNNATVNTPANTTPVTAQSGAFRFTTTTNIRTAPATSGAVVGEYYPGDVVYYDGTVKAEGYTWLRYLSRSGARHYVAIVH
uniref:SH3 domain-containing protein n=1 Tax=Lactiplantibacillus carotarum TaxID=2993456 RepID=UPI00298F0095|nr:SH3 domain-containing protein [Lactiplantibacillus carotarum]